MPYVGLTDLHLPNISRDGGDKTDEVHFTDITHNDPLTPLIRCIYAVDK